MRNKKNTIKTMTDLAKRVGLSRYTVSKVLNNDPSVKEESREAVLQACKKFNYMPNPHAVNLVRRKTRIIGMIIPHIGEPFYGEIVQVIEQESNRHGYQVILQSSYLDPDNERKLIEALRSLNICGLIIAPVVLRSNGTLLRELEESIPVVYLDHYLDENCHFVINDNFSSAQMVTEHLISRSTQPVYLSSVHGNSNIAIYHRERGYCAAMKKNGLPPIILPSDHRAIEVDSEQYGFERVSAWLDSGNRCSSIFCASDSLALGAMKALYDFGFNPGTDILIAGHDDLPMSAFLHPALTTVRQPKKEIGTAAVRIIVGHERGEYPSGTYIQRSFQSELIVRESS